MFVMFQNVFLQVFEMVDDFYKAYQAKQEYFLGAIVTTRSGEGPGSAYQVIDGQQRLTSLFIMLACLHQWAKEQVVNQYHHPICYPHLYTSVQLTLCVRVPLTYTDTHSGQ